ADSPMRRASLIKNQGVNAKRRYFYPCWDWKKDKLLEELVRQLSVQILLRPPTAEESREYAELTRSYVTKLGKRKAIQKLIQTFILSTEFVYRQEFGAGEPDAARWVESAVAADLAVRGDSRRGTRQIGDALAALAADAPR
ncbi:MAG: hypothetical protein QG661_3015, partial [Actinomycetota bacterium]|nr:hypothetical protein [Actinomycetota bacterium]